MGLNFSNEAGEKEKTSRSQARVDENELSLAARAGVDEMGLNLSNEAGEKEKTSLSQARVDKMELSLAVVPRLSLANETRKDEMELSLTSKAGLTSLVDMSTTTASLTKSRLELMREEKDNEKIMRVAELSQDQTEKKD